MSEVLKRAKARVEQKQKELKQKEQEKQQEKALLSELAELEKAILADANEELKKFRTKILEDRKEELKAIKAERKTIIGESEILKSFQKSLDAATETAQKAQKVSISTTGKTVRSIWDRLKSVGDDFMEGFSREDIDETVES